MNTTPEKDFINPESDNLTTMDLGNSFDYVHDYYVNSYDYTVDEADSIIDSITNTKGCTVVSNDDSISIVHDNGTDKHIQKKSYTSASQKYNEKKIAKEKAKATLEAKKKLAEKKSSYNSSSSTYSNKKTYNNYTSNKTTYNNLNTNSTTTNTSHTEVFGNTNKTKNNNSSLAKILIFLFVILPYVASIFFSCVSDMLDALL